MDLPQLHPFLVDLLASPAVRHELRVVVSELGADVVLALGQSDVVGDLRGLLRDFLELGLVLLVVQVFERVEEPVRSDVRRHLAEQVQVLLELRQLFPVDALDGVGEGLLEVVDVFVFPFHLNVAQNLPRRRDVAFFLLDLVVEGHVGVVDRGVQLVDQLFSVPGFHVGEAQVLGSLLVRVLDLV